MLKPVISIGAILVDELIHATNPIILATAVDASITKTAGGVAHNIAHQLALLDIPVQLISVFGNDSDGDWLKQVCTKAGVLLDAAITRNGLSGRYSGILNQDGSLFTAFLSNSAVELITPLYLEQQTALLKTASYLLADANTSLESLQWLLHFSKQTGIPFIIEPVSVPPAMKLKELDLNGLYLITPNEDELPVLCSDKAFLTQLQVNELLNQGVQYIWMHNGKQGSALFNKHQSITLHAPDIEVVDCTGAGDGSLSGFLLGKSLGMNDEACMKLAHTLSAEILQVNGAIVTHLTQQQLLDRVPIYYPLTQ
jgi:pseudouridine kinase